MGSVYFEMLVSSLNLKTPLVYEMYVAAPPASPNSPAYNAQRTKIA